ncbi:MAG: hypothetical protein ACR2KK_00685 [Acidimicrobiales bacterium]
MSTAQASFDLPPLAKANLGRPSAKARLGVFDDNRQKPIHRWFPFVEGYSADLVRRALRELPSGGSLLDPFGGSGTTALAAAELGYDSSFCEVNPYLAWVAEVKVNHTRAAIECGAHSDLATLASDFERAQLPRPSRDHPLIEADAIRGFFPDGVAADVVSAVQFLQDRCRPEAVELARLAIATSLIPASNMIRRADLRKRRPGDPAPQPFRRLVADRLRVIAIDVEVAGPVIRGTATRVAADARCLSQLVSSFDLIVTSPPYLNGTNYCRNTKLELLALGFISDERQLADLRLASVAAGINNISRRRSDPDSVSAVEAVACELDKVAYDRRIPAMVRMYFTDMRQVFAAVRRNARRGARWLLDIGDSRFCGIHIPTHDLLCEIGALEGWDNVTTETIRSRRSYDGSELTQVLLEFSAA